MTTPKLDEARLRELAEAATPGPWSVDAGDGHMDGKSKFPSSLNVLVYADDDCDIHPVADASCNHSCRIGSEQEANAAFIAAANPATIIALLDALSAERERGDKAVGLLDRWMTAEHPIIATQVKRETRAFLATQKAEGAISTPATTDDSLPPR